MENLKIRGHVSMGVCMSSEVAGEKENGPF
jgi:hypothetical protein